jgi:hypothetical protein
MKIAVITPWNQTCGISVHAELICREWIQKGHTVKIFSYQKYFPHAFQYKPDEPYVERNIYIEPIGWGWIDESRSYIKNPESLLQEEFDILVVETLSILPKQNFLPFFKQITAKKVLIIHEIFLPINPLWYKFEFEAVVCLTKGMKKELSGILNPEKLYFIPYPCYKTEIGNKIQNRLKLNLPLDKKIILLFGWRLGFNPKEYIKLFPIFKKLAENYPLHILLISKSISPTILKKLKDIPHEIRHKLLDFVELYSYLRASDLLLLPKNKTPFEVVSSQACLCLGSGCPIMAPDVNFFKYFKDEIIKYKNLKDFELKLKEILEGKTNIEKIIKNALKYASQNSSSEIAKKYINLFKHLLNHRKSNSQRYLIRKPSTLLIKLPFLKLKYLKLFILATFKLFQRSDSLIDRIKISILNSKL